MVSGTWPAADIVQIFSIGQSVGEIKALTTWGWNKHIWDVPVDRLPKVRLAAWLVEFFFLFGNACSKISILLVYRKISSGSHSYWFIKLTWAAIAFTVLYTVALALELLLICRPLSSYWLSYNPVAYDKKFTCGNEHIPILFSATASVFSDIYASILPMLLTRTLKLTTRQRLSLYALFSAGLLTAGFGLGRLAVLDRVTTDYWPGPHTHDMTWLGWPLYVSNNSPLPLLAPPNPRADNPSRNRPSPTSRHTSPSSVPLPPLSRSCSTTCAAECRPLASRACKLRSGPH
jgi:hypothetical protein